MEERHSSQDEVPRFSQIHISFLLLLAIFQRYFDGNRYIYVRHEQPGHAQCDRTAYITYTHCSLTDSPPIWFICCPSSSLKAPSVRLRVSTAGLRPLYASSSNLSDWLPVTPRDLQLCVMTTGH